MLNMSLKSKISLIPWDGDSAAHRQSLTKQRVECSWDHEKVEEVWREQQLKGEKCIYWIVIFFHDSVQYEKIKDHLDVGKGNGTLYDTATSINGVLRDPSQRSFVPIGHVSLDPRNPDAEGVGLDLPSERVFWIKTFFVSQALQSQGYGRATMDEVENMAIQEPLCAKILMLDTVHNDDQKREDFAMVTFGRIPKVTNEEWYSRRGFKLIKTVENYYKVADRNGKVWATRTVFMRKDI
ncbi:hypothetical protein BDW42DRAFT_26847 [Aspergillus taichungensis]|uniref:N-acetyltransferase domain-containing protein n=1 Tax=Aspergillus taichungensis TaxID=482145 RepID=A0A2J5HGP1_9EURO|nr:hypothetical protein BDW42DRAFT_26847 [Aspergillus taichungensis]